MQQLARILVICGLGLAGCGGGGGGGDSGVGSANGGSSDGGGTGGSTGGGGTGGGDTGGGDAGSDGGDPPFVTSFAEVTDPVILSQFTQTSIVEWAQLYAGWNASESKSGIPAAASMSYEGYLNIAAQTEITPDAVLYGVNILSPIALLIDTSTSTITGTANEFIGSGPNENAENTTMHYHGDVQLTTLRTTAGLGQVNPLLLNISGNLSNVRPDLPAGSAMPDAAVEMTVAGTLAGGFYENQGDLLRVYGSSRNTGEDSENSMTTTINGMNITSQSATLIATPRP